MYRFNDVIHEAFFNIDVFCDQEQSQLECDSDHRVCPEHLGVRANIHLGDHNEFCPNGEHKLFVTRPRQGENIIMNYCSAYFMTVVLDERLLSYPTRNVSQVDGNLFRSVTQLVKQICCLLPE